MTRTCAANAVWQQRRRRRRRRRRVFVGEGLGSTGSRNVETMFSTWTWFNGYNRTAVHNTL